MRPFRAASGKGPDWQSACDACLDELQGLNRDTNLGFVYASDPLAHAMDHISERLKEVTGIDHWVGTGGAGVCTTGQGVVDEGAIAVLTATLPTDGFRVFDSLEQSAIEEGGSVAELCRHHFAVVHGDPRQTKTTSMIERLGRTTDAFLVGGLTSANGNGAMQIAGRPTEGGLSGVLMTDDVSIVTGLSQGCTAIGPTREITAVDGAWVVTIDHQPALDVLKQDVGPILSRNLDRLSGFILAARPQNRVGHPDLLVRELGDIDPLRQMLMVGDDLRRGDPLCFVKRDPQGARADLRRMATDLRHRADNRPILGALYHSCVARGRQMFGTASTELFMIEEELGQIPLAGLFTNGEIYRDRLYGYSGVLTLFLDD